MRSCSGDDPDENGLWQQKTGVWSMLQTERSQRPLSVVLGHGASLATRDCVEFG